MAINNRSGTRDALVLSILRMLVISISLSILTSLTVSADEPIYHSLVTSGLKISESTSIPLTAPTIRDGSSVAEQKMAIEVLADDVGVERFMKNSAVSPFVLKMQPVTDSGGDSIPQRVDIWFIAYGSIDEVLDKKLLEDLVVPEQRTTHEPADESREFSQEELTRFQLKAGKLPDDTYVTFGQQQFSLFDKVRLSLVTRSTSIRSSESLIMVSHIHDQIAQVPCVWNPIVIDTDDQATLGKSHPYNQAASYTKLTSLKFMPEALLIEIHILFTEPQEWFGGRNMLRSKLPPLVQDGVRKFRRRLSQ